jgi:hypothetical protein
MFIIIILTVIVSSWYNVEKYHISHNTALHSWHVWNKGTLAGERTTDSTVRLICRQNQRYADDQSVAMRDVA